jgi:hypothetical protein
LESIGVAINREIAWPFAGDRPQISTLFSSAGSDAWRPSRAAGASAALFIRPSESVA